MQDMTYSTSINGADLTIFEFREIIRLVLEDKTDQEIKDTVIEENLFQLKESAAKRAIPYLIVRAKALDYATQKIALEGTSETILHAHFYALLKTDRLMYEFMDEVIYKKLSQQDFVLETKDLNMFFEKKAEQSDFINGLSNSTKKKMQSIYKKLMVRLGFLENRDSIHLRRVFVSSPLREHLDEIGETKFREMMEG